MMLRRYTSWNEYNKDLELRDKLERDLMNVRLKSRMMKANPVQQLSTHNEINRILSLLKNLPSNAEFYIDIHGYGKDYIYTETNIPVNAIRDTEDKSY